MSHPLGQPHTDPPPPEDAAIPAAVDAAVRRRGVLADFGKAYRKARKWNCSPLLSAFVAARFALTGDSGRFASHGGWRHSRIRRDEA